MYNAQVIIRGSSEVGRNWSRPFLVREEALKAKRDTGEVLGKELN